MRNGKLSPASIEPASAVGKQPPLLWLPARTEGHRQEEFSTGITVTTHTWLTGSAAVGMRECGRRARR